jgi:hypothetical protein
VNTTPRAARMLPPSTAANPIPGRMPHWVRGNHTERVPVRWMAADTESRRHHEDGVETQTLRLGAADFWRTDLTASDGSEHLRFTDATTFWAWVVDHCHPHGRTCLAFHNASYDLGILNAFAELPALGAEMTWCNLDRDVSTMTWRTPNGTLVVWDTYSWCPQALDSLAPLVGVEKPPLPRDDAPDGAWWDRCEADVTATRRIVQDMAGYVKGRGLGNWQPSGAGMGHTTWRHRHYTHKVLVHDDADALAAEREAMHTGRAEAWWHGKPAGGPFTEWDMHMSYCRIAAECDLPTKLWDHDVRPSARVHSWALDHWRVLARVIVTTETPVVPARAGGRVYWPVGQFATTLWDTELELLRETGGSYQVLEQWRYSRKPCLQSWAQWSIQECQLPEGQLPAVARVWVKHQSRAVIGRMALRTPSWEPYLPNWLPGYTGVSHLTEAGHPDRRLMHIGEQTWIEGPKDETRQSVPQITGWIMAEARARLYRAAQAAGAGHTLHLDTDSIITDRAGSANLREAVAAGLPGTWRPKNRFTTLDITGPRHYTGPGRRYVPGVPRKAAEASPGLLVAEVWDSLSHALSEGRGGEVKVRLREFRPRKADHRRPWAGETSGPAQPVRATHLGGENYVIPPQSLVARRTA